MRFLFSNALENGTLTSSDRMSSTFDVVNITDRRLAKKWRSAFITDLMTYGDCEETTSPYLDGSSSGLTNGTWARSAVEFHGGAYSWVLTKTTAAGAGAAVVLLTDNALTTDLHGLVAGRTYCLAAWLFTDVAALPNASIVVQEYYAAAWHDTLTLQATAASTWQEKKGSFTLNAASTGMTIKIEIATAENAATIIYLDDIRIYLENRIFHDSGSTLNPTVGFIGGHNLSSAAVVKLQGNATADWTNPTVNETLTWDVDIILKFITGQALRYWSILFDDENNPDEYIECGYAFTGTYLQATVGAARVFGESLDDKSTVMEGSSGQILGAVGAKLKEWDINVPWWTDAMKTAFEAMYEVIGNYRPFCFVLDENNLAYFKPKYIRLINPAFTHILKLQKWSLKFGIREAK